MRLILYLLLLLCSFPVLAEEEKKEASSESAVVAPDAPQMSFAQKVEVVYEAKKNPAIFDVRIEQDKNTLKIEAIVDRNIDRDTAKKIALNLVMLTKVLSFDDKPKKKDEPGKGLYDYKVTINRTDAVVLAAAEKPAKEEKLSFDAPVMENIPPKFRPLTREDAAGR